MVESKAPADVSTPPKKHKVRLQGMKGRLVNSSVDAYVMSLETINRLSVRYRLEAFNYLIVNAWELLLKAKIIHDRGNNEHIFYKRVKGEPKRSWTMSDCLKEVFADNSNVRKNIEVVEQERNKGTHLVLDVIPPNLLAIYQACVVNYHRALEDWFGFGLSDRVPVGMMTVVFDIDHRLMDLNSSVLRRRIGTDTAKYLMQRQKDIELMESEIETSVDFSAKVELRVSVTNNPRSNADLHLIGGMSGDTIGVLTKYRDASQTHRIYTRPAAAIIQERMGLDKPLTDYEMNAITYHHGLKDRPDLYYRESLDGSRPRFSEQFIDWIVAEWASNPDFIKESRHSYRQFKNGPKSP